MAAPCQVRHALAIPSRRGAEGQCGSTSSSVGGVGGVLSGGGGGGTAPVRFALQGPRSATVWHPAGTLTPVPRWPTHVPLRACGTVPGNARLHAPAWPDPPQSASLSHAIQCV